MTRPQITCFLLKIQLYRCIDASPSWRLRSESGGGKGLSNSLRNAFQLWRGSLEVEHTMLFGRGGTLPPPRPAPAAAYLPILGGESFSEERVPPPEF